jgi:hypothetical protein
MIEIRLHSSLPATVYGLLLAVSTVVALLTVDFAVIWSATAIADVVGWRVPVPVCVGAAIGSAATVGVALYTAGAEAMEDVLTDWYFR